MEITVKKKIEVRYLKVDVAVRYDDEDMPFDAPLREGKTWNAIIDLKDHRIVDWPQGKTLSFHDMKICDEGIYTLCDDGMNVLAKIDGYVPNHLLPGSYGDYLSLDIDENGVITNWLSGADLSDFEKEE